MTPNLTDIEQTRRFLSDMFDEGDLVELRALGVDGKTMSGLYDDMDALARDAVQISPRARGVYVTMNPLDPKAFAGRERNSLRPVGKGGATGNEHTLQRRGLLFDIDPIQEKEAPTTEKEHDFAVKTAEDVAVHLEQEGVPADSTLMLDTGRGAGLLVKIDLAADDDLVQRLVRKVGDEFTNEHVRIDQKVHNSGRLIRVPGTANRKGVSSEARPHRMARVMTSETAPPLVACPRDVLARLVDAPPLEPPAQDHAENDEHELADTEYGLTALESEALEVSSTSAGDRNNRLHLAAFRMGQLCVAGHLRPATVDATLLSAALAAGLERDEVIATIDSGLTAGQENPRLNPPPPARPGPSQLSSLVWQPFPTDALPQTLATYVEGMAPPLDTDPSIIALPLLAGLASAIGNSREVEIKSTWREPSILWTVAVMPSGQRKSPALDAAIFAVQEAEAAAYEQYARELSKYKEKKDDADLAAPVLERFLISDATLEAVAVRLRGQPRGLLLARDELSAWLDSFDRYNRGGDASSWPELYGARQLRVDRKSTDDPVIFVPRASLSITGTIQPGILRKSMQKHLESGLAARLLLANPPSRRRRFPDAEAPEGFRDVIAETFDRLYSLGFSESGGPIAVPLTDEARSMYGDWCDDLGAISEEASEAVQAAYSKIEGAVARIALIFHLVEHDGRDKEPGVIGPETMGKAIQLGWWFAHEANRFYTGIGLSAEEQRDVTLYERLVQHGGAITPRNVQRLRGLRFESVQQAEEALDALVDAGLGTWRDRKPGSRGGRPTREFVLRDTAGRNRVDETSAERA